MGMRVYLDNCCYNRPYDDQSQIRISLETQAKLYIQDMIKRNKIELVSSYVLEYENGKNHFAQKRQTIEDFMNSYESLYVGAERDNDITKIAEPIILSGIKEKDAFHVACAILSKCDYFVTTDDRLLKYRTEQLFLVSPCEFVRMLGGDM